MQIQPYLHFDGTCEAAFKLYEKVLGGKLSLMTHGNSPEADKVAPEWKDKILHAHLAVGDAVVMGSDVPPQYFSKPQGFSVSIMIKDPAAAERIFNGLAEKGTVKMPFQQTFWAYRFGMLEDQFGIPWMVDCEKPA
ncbi:MAG TPA: VOC family protein [Thermoanaerobaculia bacterium]|nr:VOC family protein [Thermoanaerobaculia bacterium]